MDKTMAATVVYEVNLEVDVAIAADYRAWLAAHVAEICTLPGVGGARAWEVTEPLPTPGRVGLCVRYGFRDETAFDDYLREHASRLRQDGLDRWGEEAVRIRRRVLRETALD
jgi:hypothetical protein